MQARCPRLHHGQVQLHRPKGGSCKLAAQRSGSKAVAGRVSAHGWRNNSTLAAQQLWLQRQRVLHHEPHPSDADIIELNCGGSIMVTSRSTLRQVKGSLLCLLFDPANSHLLRHDASGRVFLDHDPAAFGLLLRHLREVRAAAGYSFVPVALPAIPPADAPSFRALNTHLGLGIPDADIAAAVKKGAALAAATATTQTPYLAAGYERRSASPYASRPAPPGTPQQQQQQQWLRQQWQQQCSPGSHQQQQQQQWINTGTPGASAPSAAAAAAVGEVAALAGPNVKDSGSEMEGQQATAADWDALTYPLPVAPRQLQELLQLSSSSSSGVGGPGAPPRPYPHKQQQQQQATHGSTNAALLAGGLQDAVAADAAADPHADIPAPVPTEYSPPVVQDFYMLTSSPGNFSSNSILPAPLRVSVLTEGDMLALQHAQQQQQQQRGLAASGGGCGYEEPAAPGLLDFDIFCSTSSSSSSQGRMGLSLVVRESAGLNNVFVGLTTPNQADQRGLQIPSFGWHQVSQCPADIVSTSADDSSSSSSSSDSVAQQQQQQRWASGDLVQLVLDRSNSNSASLTLTVNNQSSNSSTIGGGNGGGSGGIEGNRVTPPHPIDSLASSISGMISSSSSNGSTAVGASNVSGSNSDSRSVTLPAFEQWCWYIALYRGTQVTAVVLDQSSYSVYSGDTKLKRYMS